MILVMMWLRLQWNTKMNSIGGEVLDAVNKSIAIAEEKYKGLVIANDGANLVRAQTWE